MENFIGKKQATRQSKEFLKSKKCFSQKTQNFSVAYFVQYCLFELKKYIYKQLYYFIERKEELKDVRTDSFYDLLVKVYENGPKVNDMEEIENAKQLLGVWNARKRIEIRFRDYSLKTEICNKGKLGLFVKDITKCLLKRTSFGSLQTDLGKVEVRNNLSFKRLLWSKFKFTQFSS